MIDDYFQPMKIKYFLYILFVFQTGIQISTVFSQKQKVFSGELTYNITKISQEKLEKDFSLGGDTTEEKMIIYAKDSLLKRVHFSSDNGIQESIEHLRLDKKILLVSMDSMNYAVQLPSNKDSSISNNYALQKKCFPKKRISGLKGYPNILQHPMLSNDLYVWHTKNIPAKYNLAYPELKGLPIKYYVISEKGLYLYTLESIKPYDPPIALFQIPIGYNVLSLKDFLSLIQN